jgi:hypothetical protein
MRLPFICIVALLALLVPAAAGADDWLDTPYTKGMPPGPYRTDKQAERFLERTRGGSAFCINGYYSRHEKRTKRHFRQRDDERFRSFKCTWTSARSGRTSDLYLQTRPNGRWVVLRDR